MKYALGGMVILGVVCAFLAALVPRTVIDDILFYLYVLEFEQGSGDLNVSLVSRRFPLFASNVYVVPNGNMSLLVDTSSRWNRKNLLRNIEAVVPLEDIGLIVITHSHYDHTGNLNYLKKHMPNAKVGIGRFDAEELRKGSCQLPGGRILPLQMATWFGENVLCRFTSYCEFEPVEPDIIFDDGFELDSFGFKGGKVFHCPGHTNGSSCIVLNDTAFAGDINWSVSGLDFETLDLQWSRLVDLGVKNFYCGHGAPIFL